MKKAEIPTSCIALIVVSPLPGGLVAQEAEIVPLLMGWKTGTMRQGAQSTVEP